MYLPKYQVCIEYDGCYYHKNKLIEDKNKNKKLKSLGYKLIRVRDDLEKISEDDVLATGGKIKKIDIDLLLQQIIFDEDDKQKIIEYISFKTFRGEALFREIISYLPAPLPKDSLESLNELSLQWDYVKNSPLLPRHFSTGSHHSAYWLCSFKGHSWKTAIAHRALGKKTGCPYCANLKIADDNNLAILDPQLAKEWHSTKNGSLLASDVGIKSEKKVYWLCSEGHTYQSIIANRTKGHGCKYCAHQSKVGREITVKGVKFISIAKAAKFYNLRTGTVNFRLQNGWSTEEALGISKRASRKAVNGVKIEVEGIVYDSLTKAANKYGIKEATVRYRLKNGWTIDKAFELKVDSTKSASKRKLNR